MSKTTVVNYRTHPDAAKGVRIMRPSVFGNPFPVTRSRSRDESLRAFKEYAEQRLLTDPIFLREVTGLHGKVLVCCCKPKPCHGDTLAELADRLVLFGGM